MRGVHRLIEDGSWSLNGSSAAVGVRYDGSAADGFDDELRDQLITAGRRTLGLRSPRGA
ncbi:MAG: hypothetical protein ACSLFA_12380 [Mycobacterium sp.]